MIRQMCVCLPAIVVILFCGSTCRADLMTTAEVNIAVNANRIEQCSNSDGALATCDLSGLDSAGESFEGTATAIAGYGTLATFATMNNTLAFGGLATVNAGFSDLLTLAGSGFIRYHFSVHATEPPAPGIAFVGLDVNNAAIWSRISDSAGLNFSHFELATPLYPILAGTPFSFDVMLEGFSQLGPGDEMSNSFLFAWAYLNGIDVFDEQMRPVRDYKLTSASGTAYVPEPSGWCLLLTCLAVIAIAAHHGRWRTAKAISRV